MPRSIATIRLANLDRECEIIAAGKDPVFGDYTPDNWSAFARIRFGKSLPQVAGPEMISGAVFGIHPAVLARSFNTIRYKQMNLGHQLKALGGKRDRIVGCVLQCAFPQEPAGGWTIPATVEEAPNITALCTLFKQAEGVSDMLGKHLGGKIQMSVSMEFSYYHDEVGIFDPSTNTVYDRADIPTSLQGYVAEDQKGRLLLRKSSRNPQLVLALGGLHGSVWFSGVGYTDRPAEETAGIDQIAASREGMMVCELATAPEFAPGMPVVWKGGEWNRGTVIAAHYDGVYILHNKRLEAAPGAGVLLIKLPDGGRIIRRASSVRKKIINS